jgi:superfamily II DNA or RNA helicase
MQVVEDKTLVLRTRNPDKIKQKIPKSKTLDITEDVYTMSVNWDLPTAQRLAALRMKNIPSPITRDYDWGGVFPPMEHQKTTAEFLTLNPRSFCFNEQGTGKTAACVWASDYLLKQGYVNRVLIVCPLSIMQSAWQTDLFQFAVHRSVGIAYGSKEKRTEIIKSNYEYVIINYDGVNVIQDAIKDGGFDLVIIDEANAYKTATTKRWKTMAKLITANTWVWMLTGTPAAQSPVDAHGLAKLCVPHNVVRSKTAYRDLVMYPVSRFKWVPKSDALDTVFNTLQPAIRFTKEECLDLPDIVYTEREASLTKQQEHYYQEVRTEFVMLADDEIVTSANAAVNINKLLQISCGAVYANSGNTLEFDVSNRLAAVKEVINESIAKVLVFVPFRHTIDLLDDYLNNQGITAECITGDVNLSKRTDIFKRFQTNDDTKVLIIQPQAAAHGVTLTAASTVIWYAPVTSTETYLQANARINRKGQTNKMTVVHIQGSPVERRLYKLLSGKLATHTQLLDLYNEVIK